MSLDYEDDEYGYDIDPETGEPVRAALTPRRKKGGIPIRRSEGGGEFARMLRSLAESEIPEQPAEQAPAAQEASGGGFGEALRDLGASVASGAGALVKSIGTGMGAGEGDIENNKMREAGKNAQEYWSSKKSAKLKGLEAERAKNIEAEDSEVGKAWVAVRDTLSDPRLASNFFAQQLPNLLPQGFVGRALMKTLAPRIGAEAAGKVGTAGAVGAGAVIQGGDVASDTYDDVRKIPEEVWQGNEDYRAMLEAGSTPEQAKIALSLDVARKAGVAGGMLSLITNGLLPRGTAIEEFLTKGFSKSVGKGGVKAALKTGATEGAKSGLGEMAAEAGEELGGKFGGNLAKREIDPNQPLTEGLGEAGAMGALGGLGTGGVFGAGKGLVEGYRGEEQVSETIPEPAEQVRAQVNAIIDPQSTKDTVFVAAGNEDAIPADLPEGVMVAQRPEGTLITSNVDKLNQFSTAQQLTDADIAAFLDFPEDKATAIQGENPRAVQARDAQGNIVAEAVTSDAGLGANEQAIQSQVPTGGTVTTAPVEQVLAEREAAVAAEQQTAPGYNDDAQMESLVADVPVKEMDEDGNLVEPTVAPDATPAPTTASVPGPVVEQRAERVNIEDPTARYEALLGELSKHAGATIDRNSIVPVAAEEQGPVYKRMAAALKKAFNVDLLVVDAPNGVLDVDGNRIAAFDGVSLGGSRTIVLNTALADRSMMNVIGHELAHQLQAEFPEIWNRLRDVALSVADRGAVGRLYGQLNKAGVTSAAELSEEAVSEIVGEQMGQPDFWTEVMTGQDKNFVDALLSVVTKLLNKVTSALTQTGFVSATRDVQQIRAAIRTAFAEWEANVSKNVPVKTGKQPARGKADAATKGKAGDVQPVDAPAIEANEPAKKKAKAKDVRKDAAAVDAGKNKKKGLSDVKRQPEKKAEPAEVRAESKPEPAPQKEAAKAAPTGDAVAGRKKAVKTPADVTRAKKSPKPEVERAPEVGSKKAPAKDANASKNAAPNPFAIIAGQLESGPKLKAKGKPGRKKVEQKAVEENDDLAEFDDEYNEEPPLRYARQIAQLSWEATPSTKANMLPGIFDAPTEAKAKYLRAVQNILFPDGVNRIARKVGMPGGRTINGYSAWEGDIGVGAQTFVAVGTRGVGDNRDVTPRMRNLLNLYSALKGYILTQDAVVWHAPIYTGDPAKMNAIELQFRRPVEEAEMRVLYNAVRDQTGTWDIAPGYTDKGVRLLSFVEGLSNDDFRNQISAAIRALPDDFGGGLVAKKAYRAAGDYVGNDWTQEKQGEGYSVHIRGAGRPDLQEWADDLRARILSVNRRFSERYDWGNPGEAASGTGALRFSRRGIVSGSPERVAASYRADQGTSLQNLPQAVTVPGWGKVVFEGFAPAQRAAAEYMQRAGLPYTPNTQYVKVDPDRAARIAEAYAAMPHDPQNPEVKAAYDAMIDETIEQYKAVLATGLEVEFIDYAKQGDPYEASPRLAIMDVVLNNHLYVFSTRDGFGSDATFDPAENPLLRETQFKISGQVALANDLFRVVHDYFGHIKNGVGFRADGEENAWRDHSVMFSPLARRAMTTETRGQNSWVNYGPFGEQNRTASGSETVFADQKTGLLPEWVMTEGAPAGLRFARVQTDTPAFKNWFGRSTIKNPDGTPKVMYHGTARDITQFQPKQANAIFITDDPKFAGDFANLSLYWMLDNAERVLTPEQRAEAIGATRVRLNEEFAGDEAMLQEEQEALRQILSGVVDDYVTTRADAILKAELQQRLPSAENILPLYVKAENPFDYENVDDLRAIEEYEAEVRYTQDALHAGDLAAIRRGDWRVIESKRVQNAIKSMGYDSFYVFELDHKNLAVYKSEQLKSAVGNYGNFDPNHPDIRFARQKPMQGNKFALPGESRADRVQSILQDNFNRVRKVQDAVTAQGGVVDPGSDVYRTQELVSGTTANKIERFTRYTVKPLVEAMGAAGVDINDVGMFMYATHAEERNNEIAVMNPRFDAPNKLDRNGSGMSTREARNILSLFQADPQYQQIKQFADQLWKIAEDTRRTQVNGGLVDPAVAAQWKLRYKNYVPLKGFENVDELGNRMPGTGRGFDVRGPESRRALGRESKAGNIVENIILDHERSIIRAEKNRVARALLKFVRQNPDDALWEVNRVVAKPIYQKSTGTVLHRFETLKDKERTVVAKWQGKEYHIVINDARLHKQLTGEDGFLNNGDDVAALFRGWASINRFLTKMWTALNPVFVVYNFARDSLTAAISGSTKMGMGFAAKVAKNAYPAMVGIAQAERSQTPITVPAGGPTNWAEWFEQYKQDGGKAGFFVFSDADTKQRELEGLLRRARAMSSGGLRGMFANATQYAMKAHDLIMDANSAIENANRVAAYRAAIEAGKTRAEAASIAKNLTVNFNRRGAWTPAIGSFYLFFNPAVQGTVRIAQAAKENPRVFMGMVAGLVALGMVNALRNADDLDEEGVPYWDKNVPDYEKSKNLVIALGGGERMNIPLAYGYGWFVSLGYALADVSRGRSIASAGLDLVQNFLQHYSPVNNFDNPLLMVTPTAMAPAVVHMSNTKNTGAPLRPDSRRMDGTEMPDSERYWGATRGTGFEKFTTWLNEITGGTDAHPGAISISPEVLKSYVTGYTGGAGTFVADVMNTAFTINDLGFEEAKSKGIIPFHRQMFKRADGRSEQAFAMRNSTKALTALAEAKNYYDSDKPAIMERIERNRGLALLGEAFGSMRDDSAAIRKEEIDIREDDSLSPAEKHARLKELDEEKARMYMRWNAEFYRETWGK